MRVVFFGTESFRGKAVMVLLVFCLFIFFLSRGVLNYYERIISIELISLSYPGEILINRVEHVRAVEEQLKKAEVNRGKAAGGSYKLVLISRKGSKSFLFEEPGRLLDPGTGDIYLLKDGGKCLASELKQLEKKNPYGEFLSWDHAKDIFRKFDKARIYDFETGKSFMVQRRAGSLHADVQPLTAEDSAIMKSIYGGKWSWRRRAIIVEVRGRRLAASMNGMPHGAGAIAGNDFKGHFCIHFLDSKTHSNAENIAHQIMVWKAAGKFVEKLVGAEPEQVMKVMVVALEQGDHVLASKLFTLSTAWSEPKIREQLAKIKWLTVSKISRPKTEGGTIELNLISSYELTGGNKFQNRPIGFILLKDEKSNIWKIDPSSLQELFAEPTAAEEQEEVIDEYSDWNVDNRL